MTTTTPFIYLEKVNRTLIEAETDGLIAYFVPIKDWFQEGNVPEGQTAYDGCYFQGDGEKLYGTVVVPAGVLPEDAIRADMREKASNAPTRTAPYTLVEKNFKRNKAAKAQAHMGIAQDANTITITADKNTFVFTKDSSQPMAKDGHPYAFYTYTVNGKHLGEVEIRGDHAHLYEVLPIVQAYVTVENVRKYLAQEQKNL